MLFIKNKYKKKKNSTCIGFHVEIDLNNNFRFYNFFSSFDSTWFGWVSNKKNIAINYWLVFLGRGINRGRKV